MALRYDLSELNYLEAVLRDAGAAAFPRSIAQAELRSAARPMLAAVRAGAPRRTGQLRKEARIKSVNDNDTLAKALVGIRKGRGRRGNITHLITRGFSGAGRGRNVSRPANDFLGRAYSSTAPQVFATFGQTYGRRVEAWFQGRRFRR